MCCHGSVQSIVLANQMGHITVIAWVARDLWQCKQTLSSGFALGLGSFTATNPWHPCYNYYIMYCRSNVKINAMKILNDMGHIVSAYNFA